MTLPLIPTRSQDTKTWLQRAAETINDILTFRFDDWRTRTAAEVAANVYPVNSAYPPGDVRRYGYVADNSTDVSAAVQSAIDVAATSRRTSVILPGGTARFGTTLNLRSGVNIIGRGSEATILNYTGSGRGFYSISPGTRIYDIRMHGIGLYDIGTGTVGIELDSISTSCFSDLWVNGFSTCGIRVYSPTSGYSVYNRFYHVTCNENTIGFQLDGTSSNANAFISCRANNASATGTTGWDFSNANGNQIIACHPEGMGTAIRIDASGAALSPGNVIIGNRFEGCTTAISIASSNVEDTYIGFNHYTANTTNVSDSGTRTVIYDPVGTAPGVKAHFPSTVAASANGHVRFVRDAEGGSSLPLAVFRDSASSGGTPVTVQAETERAAGSFYRGVRGGTTYYDVVADGTVRVLSTGILRAVGSGSPESVLTAPVGSTYQRTDGGAGTSFYVKESGSGNTGWVAK